MTANPFTPQSFSPQWKRKPFVEDERPEIVAGRLGLRAEGFLDRRVVEDVRDWHGLRQRKGLGENPQPDCCELRL